MSHLIWILALPLRLFHLVDKVAKQNWSMIIHIVYDILNSHSALTTQSLKQRCYDADFQGKILGNKYIVQTKSNVLLTSFLEVNKAN